MVYVEAPLQKKKTNIMLGDNQKMGKNDVLSLTTIEQSSFLLRQFLISFAFL